MAKKNNMSKGLGPFSKLDKFHDAVMRTPRQKPTPTPAGVSLGKPVAKRGLQDTNGIARDVGVRAVGDGKIRKYYGAG